MMKKLLLVFVAAVSVAAPLVASADETLKLRAIDQVVEQHDRAIQACGHGRRGDTLAVVLQLTIDEYGRVTEAEATSRSPEAVCLEKIARRLSFPSSTMQTRLAYPFLLVPHTVHR